MPPSSPGPSAAQGRSLPLTEVRARHPTFPPAPDPKGPQLGGARWEEGSTPKVAIGRWRYKPLQTRGSQPELQSRSGV